MGIKYIVGDNENKDSRCLQDMRCGGMCTAWNITKDAPDGKGTFSMPEPG